MIAHKFSYTAPRNATEAAEILGRSPGSNAVLGGGTWVVPEMSQRKRAPEVVVDLRRAGLDRVTTDGDAVVIGAATTYSTVLASEGAPRVLRDLAAEITGGAQIRNQGTLGGSACYANPASDVPGALVALEATLAVRSASGVREVPAEDFFVDAFTTCLEPGDLVESIVVESSVARRRGAHLKFKTAEGSWPIVTATCVAGAGGVTDSVVIGGAAPTPFRVRLDQETDVADRVREVVGEPWEDVLATANFRRHVAGVMAARVVQRLNEATGERR